MNEQTLYNQSAEGPTMYYRWNPEKLALQMNRVDMKAADVARELSRRLEPLGLRCTATSVHGWIKGENRPKADYAANLALILRCRWDDLFDMVN